MSPCESRLSTGHVVGLAFNAQASILSLVSVSGFLLIVLVKYCRNWISPPDGPWRLLRTNIDAFMLNLLLSDAVMAVAGVIDLKWVVAKRSYCGAPCSTQGMMNFMGFTASAFFTTAIALQTWFSIYSVRHRTYSLAVWLTFSAAVWIYVFLFTFLEWVTHQKEGLPGDGSDFYRPTPFWCSVNSDYKNARMAGQYVWLWICAFGSIVIYVPLYLFSRGNLDFIEVEGRVRWKWYFPAPTPTTGSGSHESLEDDADYEQDMRTQAWKMLLYPIAYVFQILGLSIVRWVTFVTQPNGVSLARDPTLGGYAAAHLVFGFVCRLGGILNVIIIITTRPGLLLFGSRGVLDRNDHRARNDTRYHFEPDVVTDIKPKPPREETNFYLPQLNSPERQGSGQTQSLGIDENYGAQ